MRPRPVDPVRVYRDQRTSASNAAILAELAGLAALPDEDDPAWDDDRIWKEQAYPFLALTDLAGERRLRAAIPLILERASYGDPGETMRGLRHSLEAIVAPDWMTLADECARAVVSARPGTRLWAVSELGVLAQAKTLPSLISALDDEAELVRVEGCRALVALCRANPQCRPAAIEALSRLVVGRWRDAESIRAGQRALASIQV